MPNKKTEIDDAQIIALYESGYSQNDIVEQYNVSVLRTRSVLQNAGYDTRNYRTMNDTMKRVIKVLVKEGVYYLQVERVTDLSFHAVRDYVFDNLHPIQGRKTTPPQKVCPSVEKFPVRDSILADFESGISFCLLANKYSLCEQDILYFYLSVTDEALSRHRKALKAAIRQDLDSGLNVGMIARNRWISRAIAKKYSDC